MDERKFHVYIVESLKDIDFFDNRFVGRALKETLELCGISSSYRIANSLKFFKLALQDGLIEYYSHLPYSKVPAPIIHIIAHGNTNGIRCGRKKIDRIGWDELKSVLLPAREIWGGKLTICFSSCKGFSACQMALKEGDCPFEIVVGSPDDISFSQSIIGYSTFYHLYRQGKDLDGIRKAMNAASGARFMWAYSNVIREVYKEEFEKAVLRQRIKNWREYISKK